MKRLLCGTLTALFISLPLYANSPDASTSTTTEAMKTETMSPSGEVQKEEESVHRSSGSTMSPSHESHKAHDAQMQQSPMGEESMKKESTTTTEKVED